MHLGLCRRVSGRLALTPALPRALTTACRRCGTWTRWLTGWRRPWRLALELAPLGLLSLAGCNNCASKPSSSNPASSLSPPASGQTKLIEVVGSQQCIGCHRREWLAWKTSHHELSTQAALPNSLRPRFRAARVRQGRESLQLYGRHGKLYLRASTAKHRQHEWPIAGVVGVAPWQQLLIDIGGGRHQALSLAWDSRAKTRRKLRWFNLASGDPPKPSHPEHWSRRTHTWNSHCADCHQTGFVKDHRYPEDRFQSSAAAPRISCEGCHGSAKAHLKWAESPRRDDDASRGLTLTQSNFASADWIFPPGKPTAVRSGQAVNWQVEVCSGCHGNRRLLRPWLPRPVPLEDHSIPTELAAPTTAAAPTAAAAFHQGQGFDILSRFGRSRMAQAGVVCSDCHDPHRGDLWAEGNALCAQCHQSSVYDRVEHLLHPPGTAGSRCTDCHMPAKAAEALAVRHDHGFAVPRPDLLHLGVEDTCTNCHHGRRAAPQLTNSNDASRGRGQGLDGKRPQEERLSTREAAATWAAAIIEERFGPTRRDDPEETLLRVRADEPGYLAHLSTMIEDDYVAPLIRAEALTLLVDKAPSRALRLVRRSLSAPQPALRLAAVHSAAALKNAKLRRLLVAATRDPVFAVRTEALRLSLRQQGADALEDAWPTAAYDLQTTLEANRDTPAGLLRWAGYLDSLGQGAAAKRARRRAAALAR